MPNAQYQTKKRKKKIHSHCSYYCCFPNFKGVKKIEHEKTQGKVNEMKKKKNNNNKTKLNLCEYEQLHDRTTTLQL